MSVEWILTIAAAFHAVLNARTAQGATAWAVGLVSFPLVALPLYAAFGRSKFKGCVAARAADDGEVLPIVDSHLSRRWVCASGCLTDSVIDGCDSVAARCLAQ